VPVALNYDFAQISHSAFGLDNMIYTHRAAKRRSRELGKVDPTEHGFKSEADGVGEHSQAVYQCGDKTLERAKAEAFVVCVWGKRDQVLRFWQLPAGMPNAGIASSSL